MKTKKLHELRSIAKDKSLRGFYKPKKADLLSLLLEQSSEETPTSAPRSKGKERRPLLPVKIIPRPQEMDEFEKEELKKSTPVVKNRLSELCDSMLDYEPKPTKKAIKKFKPREKKPSHTSRR